MRRVLLLSLAVLPAACWSVAAAADEEPRRPGLPEPGVMFMFERLDRNGDGAVSEEEVPDSFPDRLKEMLKQADADEDQKVTGEEFRAALQKRGGERRGRGFPARGGAGAFGGPPPFARRGGADRRGGPDRRPDGERKADAAEVEGEPQRSPNGPRARGTRPGAGRGDQGRPGPGPGRRPLPDPKLLFQRLDRNDDGKLDQDEFTSGMRAMRSRMGRQGPGRGPRPGFGLHRHWPGPGPLAMALHRAGPPSTVRARASWAGPLWGWHARARMARARVLWGHRLGWRTGGPWGPPGPGWHRGPDSVWKRPGLVKPNAQPEAQTRPKPQLMKPDAKPPWATPHPKPRLMKPEPKKPIAAKLQARPSLRKKVIEQKLEQKKTEDKKAKEADKDDKKAQKKGRDKQD